MGDKWTPVKGGKLWSDPAFIELSYQAQILFIWSWTSDRSRIGGIYRVTRKQMVGEALGLQWSEEADQMLEEALEELERKPLLAYDDEHEVIWVINRAKHANTSETHADWMYRDWLALPDCEIKKAFKKKYPGIIRMGEVKADKRREQTRIRVARHRERQKAQM